MSGNDGLAHCYRHLKSGGLYCVIAEGKMEMDQTPVVVYENLNTGEIWIRPHSEFYDGRFKRIEDNRAYKLSGE